MSLKTTLLISLISLSLLSINAQVVEEATTIPSICHPPVCPAIMIQKEVNGVTLGFAPCCPTCEPCTNDYVPVCLSVGGTFATYLNACVACSNNSDGQIAGQACPEPAGWEGSEEGEVCTGEWESCLAEGNVAEVEVVPEESGVDVIIAEDDILNTLL